MQNPQRADDGTLSMDVVITDGVTVYPTQTISGMLEPGPAQYFEAIDSFAQSKIMELQEQYNTN